MKHSEHWYCRCGLPPSGLPMCMAWSAGGRPAGYRGGNNGLTSSEGMGDNTVPSGGDNSVLPSGVDFPVLPSIEVGLVLPSVIEPPVVPSSADCPVLSPNMTFWWADSL